MKLINILQCLFCLLVLVHRHIWKCISPIVAWGYALFPQCTVPMESQPGYKAKTGQQGNALSL